MRTLLATAILAFCFCLTGCGGDDVGEDVSGGRRETPPKRMPPGAMVGGGTEMTEASPDGAPPPDGG